MEDTPELCDTVVRGEHLDESETQTADVSDIENDDTQSAGSDQPSHSDRRQSLDDIYRSIYEQFKEKAYNIEGVGAQLDDDYDDTDGGEQNPWLEPNIMHDDELSDSSTTGCSPRLPSSPALTSSDVPSTPSETGSPPPSLLRSPDSSKDLESQIDYGTFSTPVPLANVQTRCLALLQKPSSHDGYSSMAFNESPAIGQSAQANRSIQQTNEINEHLKDSRNFQNALRRSLAGVSYGAQRSRKDSDLCNPFKSVDDPAGSSVQCSISDLQQRLNTGREARARESVRLMRSGLKVPYASDNWISHSDDERNAGLLERNFGTTRDGLQPHGVYLPVASRPEKRKWETESDGGFEEQAEVKRRRRFIGA